MSKKEKTIYDLKLHETLKLPRDTSFSPANYPRHIMRVPGGWIYTYNEYDEESHGVFVPFNREFDEERRKELEVAKESPFYPTGMIDENTKRN